jgi:hypothetical protein
MADVWNPLVLQMVRTSVDELVPAPPPPAGHVHIKETEKRREKELEKELEKKECEMKVRITKSRNSFNISRLEAFLL